MKCKLFNAMNNRLVLENIYLSRWPGALILIATGYLEVLVAWSDLLSQLLHVDLQHLVPGYIRLAVGVQRRHVDLIKQFINRVSQKSILLYFTLLHSI